jgi:CspA family cold shock protein
MAVARVNEKFEVANTSNKIQVRGTVKFFDRNKGYGFIVHNKSRELGDAFVHITLLKKQEIEKFPEGATVDLLIEKDECGYKASHIIGVDESTSVGDSCISEKTAIRESIQPEKTSWETGTLKWFDRAKGFGFIVLDQCGQDAFIHYNTIRRSKMSVLFNPYPGSRYKVKWGWLEGKKSVTEISLYIF